MDVSYPPKVERAEPGTRLQGLFSQIYLQAKRLSPVEHSASAGVLVITTLIGIVGWKTHDATHAADLPVIVEQLLVVVEKLCQGTSALIILSGGMVYFFDRQQNISFSRLTKCVGRVKLLLRIKYDYRYINTQGPIDDHWKENMRQVTEMGRMAYGNGIKRDKRLRAYTRWFLANPKSFLILTANGYPIGFLCCLAMSTAENVKGTMHYDGDCAELDIDESMISSGTSPLILQQGVYIHPGFQNEETAKLLLEGYAWMMANLISGIEGTTIYAEPVSPENNALLSKFGFTRSNRKSRLRRQLYEMKLDDTNDEGYSVVQSIVDKFNSLSKDKNIHYN